MINYYYLYKKNKKLYRNSIYISSTHDIVSQTKRITGGDMLGGVHWKKVRTAKIYDETYPNPYRLSKIPKYNRLINMKYDNPLAFYKLILRIWEIRSWVHLNGNTFNDDYTNWNHHKYEPLMGISDVDTNPLFNWAINAKNIINNETDKVITSYFFNKDKYRFLYNITQGDYLGNLGGIALDTDKSKCIIFENETNNQDGFKGQVLYTFFVLDLIF